MEVEWKFLAEKRVHMEYVTHACAKLGWQVAPAGRAVIHDIYYDTVDRRLLAAGECVRRRTENGRSKLTVKSASAGGEGLFRREETETPMGQVDPNYFNDRKLIPTLTVNNTRRIFLAKKGEAAVEIALDMVSFRFGMKARRDWQVELELKSDGGEEELERLGRELQELCALTPQTQSKYQRGMALTAC